MNRYSIRKLFPLIELYDMLCRHSFEFYFRKLLCEYSSLTIQFDKTSLLSDVFSIGVLVTVRIGNDIRETSE